jgi:hypothetical protein
VTKTQYKEFVMQIFPLNLEEIAVCLSTPAGGAGEISGV